MEKKTVRRVFLAALFVLLAEQIFFIVCGLCLPAQYGDTFMGELKSKYKRLQNTPGKRIVLVGGSGVAFDCDSTLIKEMFPEYEVVNFGMYAGLGTKAVLDLSEKEIHEGDIVILSPEQSTQTLSDYFNGTYMWQAADGAFGLLCGVKKENLEDMLGTFPAFALEKLKYTVKGQLPQTDSVYRKSSFNAYGDVVLSAEQQNVMPYGYDTNQPVRFAKEEVQPEFLSYINAWAKCLEQKGAAVWYRYCPVNRLAVENGEDIQTYDTFLRQALAFPVIGNPKGSLMEPEWFFDTNFHLNSAGKTVNTVQLIRDIKAMLGDTRKVTITLPKKPQQTWQEQAVEEKVWTKDDSAAFKEAETIEIPETVTQIEDGAFSECPKLKRIVLKQTDPSRCMVGQQLLDKTTADIFVPGESLDSYKRNYFWSVYADRLQKDADGEKK